MSKVPVVRVLEDAVLVAGTAVTAWQASHSVTAVLAAVSSAPLVRSGLALLVSGGHSSGLVEAYSIVRSAVKLLTASQAKPAGTA